MSQPQPVTRTVPALEMSSATPCRIVLDGDIVRVEEAEAGVKAVYLCCTVDPGDDPAWILARDPQWNGADFWTLEVSFDDRVSVASDRSEPAHNDPQVVSGQLPVVD